MICFLVLVLLLVNCSHWGSSLFLLWQTLQWRSGNLHHESVLLSPGRSRIDNVLTSLLWIFCIVLNLPCYCQNLNKFRNHVTSSQYWGWEDLPSIHLGCIWWQLSWCTILQWWCTCYHHHQQIHRPYWWLILMNTNTIIVN